VARALVRGGITLIEVTMTIPNAVDVLTALAAEVPDGVLLGAGSVVQAEPARAVVAAGARFVVSPVLAAAIAPVAAAGGAACVLGALTPSEMVQATAAGADFVKVFPADAAGGPAYFRAVLAPLPALRLLPSGGVKLENFVAYLEAGAVALALGSDLAPAGMVKAGDWDGIAARAANYVAALDAWRSRGRP
jgi:2-dehydro-3-deoxyphosphogluconate aldolase/(4S)-4-hydroxy-2-oxoglutarate aldolase